MLQSLRLFPNNPTYIFILLLMCPLYGCSSTSDSTEPSSTDSSTSGTTTETNDIPSQPQPDGTVGEGPFDGTYTLTFVSGGVQMAIGSLVIVNSDFDGELVNVLSEVFPISGRVDSDGNFIFHPIEGNLGTQVDAEGYIQNGLVSGSYNIDDREGVVSGSLGSDPFQYSDITEFDGTYEASFSAVADAEGTLFEVATTVFTVEEGRFKTSVTTIADAHFEIAGFVTSDGTVVISMMTGYAGIETLQAEGNIDHETFEIQGMYRIGSFAGVVSGRVSD